MLNNIALDVAIGLIFVYLIYSLLASILLEIVAKMFSLRSRNLTRALRRMLQDEPQAPKWSKYTVSAWVGEFIRDFYFYFIPIDEHSMLQKFYKHPTIRYLGENSIRNRPSYIYPSMFSQTMVQLLRGGDFKSAINSESEAISDSLKNNLLNMDDDTIVQFRNLFEDARHDTLQFRILMERWFDEMMQTAAAWYQRQSQILLIFIGLFLGYNFNIDTIKITNILAKDKKAREQMVQMAISREDEYKKVIEKLEKMDTKQTTGQDTAMKAAVADLRELTSADDTLKKQINADADKVQQILGIGAPVMMNCDTRWDYICGGFLGWLLTALAISLGAPFWFDLLSKLLTVRRMVRKDEPNTPVTTAESRNLKIVG